MRDNNIKTLFLCSLLLASVFAATAPTTECASHKGWAKVKAFIKDFTSSESGIADDLSAMITAYETAIPTVGTTDSLGKCSAYAGQKSCCNSDITKYLDSIVLYKAKPILIRENIITKFVKFYYKLIANSVCTAKQGVTKPASASEILANADNISQLKPLVDGLKTAKVAFAKAISAFTRGAVCLACAGIDTVSSYFDKDQYVIVSQASVTAFTDATANILTTFNSLLTSNNLEAAAGTILQYYLDASSPCIQTGVSQFTNFKNKFNYQISGTNVCTGLNLFIADTACQQVFNGASSIDSLEPSTPSRNLGGTSGDTVIDASTGGINVYIVSPTDDTINESGTMKIDSTFGSGARETFMSAILFISLFFIIL